MAFTQITVTGRWGRPGMPPYAGDVAFTPTEPMVNGATVVSAPTVATLSQGGISVQLPATDDPATLPRGVLYRVQERIPRQGWRPPYYINVPAGGGPIDLATASRLDRGPAPASAPVTRDELTEVLGNIPGGGVTEFADLDDIDTTGAAIGGIPTASHATGDTVDQYTVIPWMLNVRAFGATGDGDTDDRAAIQAAIDACATAGGGTVYLPAGTYMVGDTLAVTTSQIRIQGEGVGATRIEKTDDVPLLRFAGTTGPDDHIVDCAVTDLHLRGADHSGTLLDVTYATRFLAHNLHLFGNTDTAIDTVEVWDSRFKNVYVEWCSGDDTPAVWVRSSRAASGPGSSTDSTNQILFEGCLVESWRGGAVRVEAGVGSPEGIYSVHFYGTKIETHQLMAPAVVVGDGASNISLTDTYVYLSGFADGFTTPVDAVVLGGDGMNKIDGCYIGVGDEVLASGVNITGSGATVTNVEGAYFSGAPSTGSHIRVTGGSDFTFGHIRSDNADESVSGLSEFSQANPGPPLRVVGGPVSDASFAAAPPQGTIAVDTSGYRLYVKTDDGWKYVPLT